MAIIQRLFPKLTKKAANFYVTVVSPSSSNFTDIFGKTSNISDSELMANWETVPQLFSLTDWITNKIANIPIKVVKASGRDAKNSEVWKLIESPNHYQSFQEFVKEFFTRYEVTGNGFVYGIKPDGMPLVTQLYNLPNDKTKVVLLYDKTIPAWMNEVSGYLCTIGGKEYNLDVEMVMHEKYVNLRYDDGSWVYGMSKYVPGDKINRELKAIHDSKTSIIEKRGAVGILTNESEMPDPQLTKEVQEKLAEQYGLKDDQNKFIVTTEKLKYTQMGLGVQELQLIENAKYSFNEMCWLNGIDPVVFSTEGSTFANKKEAKTAWVREVLIPKVDNFYKQLSIFVGEGYNGDAIQADWDQVEELQQDRKVIIDIYTKAIEVAMITPKMAAEEMGFEFETDNEPPDEYFRKSSLVPVEAEDEPPQMEETTDMPNGGEIEDDINKYFKLTANGNGKPKNIPV